MRVTIEVESFKGEPLMKPLSASFDQKGGTLGRASGNDFVLADPDRYISREHAVIVYENGCYYLKDSSTEGTYITNKGLHVHHDSVPLADGDKLNIGDYDLIVHILSGEAEDELSFFKFDQNKSPNSEPGMGHDIGSKYHPANDESFVPPEVDAPSKQLSDIPNNIDFFFGDDEEALSGNSDDGNRSREDQPGQPSAEGIPDVPRPLQPGPPEAYRDLLHVFLEAAGIEETNLFKGEEIPELIRTVGAVFRELIDGLIKVLLGRKELKGQFRLPVTILRAVENNPLKFFDKFESFDHALRRLLIKDDSGYVDPVHAVRQGYEDIMNHQLAVLAGTQASLMRLLKRFSPQQFSRQYEGGIVFQKKARCWDAYSEAYREIEEEAQRDCFGEEFVRAYEEEIQKLRATRNKS